MKKITIIILAVFVFSFAGISSASSVPDQSFLTQTASVISSLWKIVEILKTEIAALSGRSQLAQVGGGNVINATSCEYADVQAAVSSVSVGGTVNVPAGNCTWTSKLTLDKGIGLIGAGADRTVIANGIVAHDYLIQYKPANYDLNTPVRISGFGFDLGNNGPGILFGTRNKTAPFVINTKGRIDHNKFYNARNAGYQAIWNTGTVRGVVDNNIFDGVAYPTRADTGAGASWWDYFPLVKFGAANDSLYFEDNVFTNVFHGIISDCQYNGRYIFRYNTISIPQDPHGSYPLFDMHGNANSTFYSCFGGEIYGNSVDEGIYGATFLAQRGGRVLVFNNYLKGNDGAHIKLYEEYPDSASPTSSGNTQTPIESYYWNNWTQRRTELQRIYTSISTSASWANGLVEDVNFFNSKDGFNGTTGVGCGPLSTRPPTCSTGVGYWATDQSCSSVEPATVGAHPAQPISGTLYKCTSPNIWTSYYTPFTYPHPIRTDCASYPTLCDSSAFIPPPPIIPVSGLCSSTPNACSSGTLSDQTDTATTYLWSCQGSGGGSTASCSSPIPPGETPMPVVTPTPTLTPTPTPEVTPAQLPHGLSSTNITNITTTGASISWTTPNLSIGWVEYGLTPSYGNTTPPSTFYDKYRLVNLTNLLPNTVYHYRIRSRDYLSVNVLDSADQTFTTLSNTPVIAPLSQPVIQPSVNQPASQPVSKPAAKPIPQNPSTYKPLVYTKPSPKSAPLLSTTTTEYQDLTPTVPSWMDVILNFFETIISAIGRGVGYTWESVKEMASSI